MVRNEHANKKITKKQARQLVYDRLVVALAEFKTGIKDKKFENNLKRASKLFAVDIAKATGRDKAENKKRGKKKVEQAPEEVVND